jgi:hypothetical protein
VLKCPACGSEVGELVENCPKCHLPGSLFDAVRDAAGAGPSQDTAYLRTIGELLATVDREGAPRPMPAAGPGLLGRAARFPALRPPAPPPVAEVRPSATVPQLRELPQLPEGAPFAETRRRLDEYFLLGRRLGLDFTDFEARFGAATLSDDLASLDVLVREMFVHLASVLAEEYDSALSRRNELAQLMPTRSADVEFDAVRRAITVGDLAGAQRRLVHVRDVLMRSEEEWEVGRILVTECDLLAETLRDLGGDPTPGSEPLEAGRRCVREGLRNEAERNLAHAAVILWALLEPRFMEDLKRLRDKMVETRSAGGDVDPALTSLREIAAELRQRNFGGTIIAYRSLRAYLDRLAAPEGSASEPLPVGRTAPPA